MPTDGAVVVSSRSRRSAWPLILVLLALFYASLASLGPVYRVSYATVLSQVGVPTMPSVFADVRNILAALECRRRGVDPLWTNPCDPTGLPLAYPRVWLVLRHLPIDQSWTTPLGLLVGALFYAAVAWLLREVPLKHSPVCLALLFSPALLLLVERANNDAIMFALLVLAVTLTASTRLSRRALGYLLTFTAAALKLYPIVGGVAALREPPRRAAFVIGSLGVVFLGYCVTIRESLVMFAQTRARGLNYSYGLDVFLGLIGQVGMFRVTLGPMAALVVAYGGLLTVLLGGYYWARRLVRAGGGAGQLHERGLAFLVGAAIFGATFLGGENWDYRLAFLLFCVPQLSTWVEKPALQRRLAWLGVTALIVSVWAGFLMPVILVRSIRLLVFPLADQAADWLALLCLWTGSLVLLPPEFRCVLRLDPAGSPATTRALASQPE